MPRRGVLSRPAYRPLRIVIIIEVHSIALDTSGAAHGQGPQRPFHYSRGMANRGRSGGWNTSCFAPVSVATLGRCSKSVCETGNRSRNRRLQRLRQGPITAHPWNHPLFLTGLLGASLWPGRVRGVPAETFGYTSLPYLNHQSTEKIISLRPFPEIFWFCWRSWFTVPVQEEITSSSLRGLSSSMTQSVS